MSGLAAPRLTLERGIDFARWRPEDDLELRAVLGRSNNAAITRRGVRRLLGIGIEDSLANQRGVLDGCGAAALIGGTALVDWVTSDARCESVRVLALDPDTETARLAPAVFLTQLRRLFLTGDSGGMLGSPWLGPLTSLRWWEPGSLAQIARLPQLRELRLWQPANPAHAFARTTPRPARLAPSIDELASLFAGMRARLRLVELAELTVPIDALAAHPIEELAVVSSTLRGAELLGAMPELRALDVRNTSFDDGDVQLLTRCRKLRRLDLTNTRVTDASVPVLAAMHLDSLQLAGTEITDPAALQTVSSLRLP